MLSTTLAKPLPTGGVVGITASTDYSKFSQQSAQQTAAGQPELHPAGAVRLEQPLLRLFGVEINQISNIGPLRKGRFCSAASARPAGSGPKAS